MRRLAIFLVFTMIASPTFSQKVQRSSSPNGMQVEGNVNLSADQRNASVITVGQDNQTRNSVAGIRSGVQIQGNTTIKAEQKNATTVTIGKGNAAENQAGVIGGK